MNDNLSLAKQSLDGLSVGDAFGELFFEISPYQITSSQLPARVWEWTDDTHMALSANRQHMADTLPPVKS